VTTPSAEAVEAAAKALAIQNNEDLTTHGNAVNEYREYAVHALSAAMPFIVAQVCNDLAERIERDADGWAAARATPVTGPPTAFGMRRAADRCREHAATAQQEAQND
jgi:hypothetical protein